jgi:hypothetical protein
VTVPVRLKGIRVERARQFGDVYLALALWRGTGLAELCEQLLPAGKEQVAWGKAATCDLIMSDCAKSFAATLYCCRHRGWRGFVAAVVAGTASVA